MYYFTTTYWTGGNPQPSSSQSVEHPTIGVPVFTGYLPGFDARVEFFYGFPVGESSADFPKYLEGTSARHLFSMFCAGWKASPDFTGQGIEHDHLDYFKWVGVDKQSQSHALQVTIKSIKTDSVEFEFACRDKNQKEGTILFAVSRTTTIEDKFSSVEPTYIENRILARKQVIHRRANKVNDLHVPPVLDSRSVIMKRNRIIGSTASFEDRVTQSINDDPLFPVSIRFLIEEAVEEAVKDKDHEKDKEKDKEKEKEKEIKKITALKRMSLKKIIEDSLDSRLCGELKTKLRTALKEKIDLEEKNDLKEKKDKKYTQMSEYLEKSIFPYMKQDAIAYLLLEHMVDFLYDTRQANPDQTLFKIVDDWMTEYSHTYLMGKFDSDLIAATRKEYKLDKTTQDNFAKNAYGLELHSENVTSIVIAVHDLADTQDAFLAIPPEQESVSFSDDIQSGRLAIKIGESGFEIKFKRETFVAALRAQRLQKAKDKLLNEFTSPADALAPSDNQIENFRSSKIILHYNNGVPHDYNIVPQDYTGFTEKLITEMTVSSDLSAEEKISWLVSLWIIECSFLSDDIPALRQEKIALFKKKVDKFVEINCIDEKSCFKKEDILASIAFYISKNKGERFKNLHESDAKKQRLSIEYRKEMIRAIYKNQLPNVIHNTDDSAFTKYIKELSEDVTPLDIKGYDLREEYLGYLKEYYLLARPYGTAWIKNSNRAKLISLTNLLMALSNAGFLDANGVPNQNSVTHKRILRRRECLVELIFHALVEKIDPIAKEEYASKYDPANVEQIVRTAFKHVDALLTPSSSASTKHSSKGARIAVIQENTASNSVTPVVKKQDEQNDPALEVKMQDEQKVELPKIQEVKNPAEERASYFDVHIVLLNQKIEGIQASLKNNSRTDIDRETFVNGLRAKVNAYAGSRDDFVDGKLSEAELDKLIKDCDRQLDSSVADEEERLSALKKERSSYRSKDIEKLAKAIADIKNLCSPAETSGSDETGELVTNVFGNELINQMKHQMDDDFPIVANNRNFYIVGSTTKECLDKSIDDLAAKLETFQTALRNAHTHAAAFSAVKSEFDAYLSSSLIGEHQAAVTDYQRCKSIIDGRGFFAKLRSMFGCATEKAENAALKAAEHQVKVLAMMISLDGIEEVTTESLDHLDCENLDQLQENLAKISLERIRLQAKWFPPSDKIKLYLEVEEKLQQQILQIGLKQRILEIQNTKDAGKKTVMINTLFKTSPFGHKKSVWGMLLEKLESVTTALTALRDLFSAKKDCEKKMAPMTSTFTNSLTTFTSTLSSSSKQPPGSLEPVSGQRNRL